MPDLQASNAMAAMEAPCTVALSRGTEQLRGRCVPFGARDWVAGQLPAGLADSSAGGTWGVGTARQVGSQWLAVPLYMPQPPTQ